MFYSFLLLLLFVDSVLLLVAILVQSGKGGGLAASFGGVSSSASSFLGARQTGNLLTKASWWLGGIFLGLAFVLSLASTRNRTPRSVLDQAFPANTPTTAPAAPGGASVPSAVPLEVAPAPQASGTKAPGGKVPATKSQTTKKP